MGNNIEQFYNENNDTWLSQVGPESEYFKGWWLNPSTNQYYFFREASGTRVNGWQYIDGDWYYFRDSGSRASDWQYIDGDWYFFQEDGKRYISQWVWLPVNDEGQTAYNWKYFNPDGKNIAQFYRENGSIWLSNSGPNKAYQKGWWLNPENNLIYYFRETSGSRVSGWQKIYNNWQYFRGHGTLAEGRQFIDGKWYDLDNFVSSTHSKVYFDELVYEDGQTRYYDSNGFRYRGWKKLDDAFLYFDNDGNALKGLQNDGQNYYFFNDQGKAYKGFYNQGDDFYYSLEDKELPILYVSGWFELDGEEYYSYSDGKLASGQVIIDDEWYEFKSIDGNPPILLGPIKYTDEGILLGSRPFSLEEYGNGSYYYDNDGNRVRLSGIHTIDGDRYYFYSGGLVREGWVVVDQDTVLYTDSKGLVDEAMTNSIEYGVDVSKWNGTNSNGTYSADNIDFQAMKEAGIDFVILRAGYGRFLFQEDPIFDQAYEKAKEAGLKIGTYHYSYAVNEDQARREAEVFLEIIEGKEFDYPVFIDMEEEGSYSQGSLSKKELTDLAIIITDEIRNAGYTPGIYANKNWFTNKFDLERIPEDVDLWMASWNSRLDYNIGRDISLWQYTDKGKVPGNSGNFDLNISFNQYE